MAFGICNNCGKEVHWSARRGCSIKNVRCSCGGTVRGKTSGQPGKNLGRKQEICVVCGRRAYLFLHPQEEYRTSGYHDSAHFEEAKAKRYPTGSPCCGSHEPRPATMEVNPRDIHDNEPAWLEGMNRLEVFLHAARGGKGTITVWHPSSSPVTHHKETPEEFQKHPNRCPYLSVPIAEHSEEDQCIRQGDCPYPEKYCYDLTMPAKWLKPGVRDV